MNNLECSRKRKNFRTSKILGPTGSRYGTRRPAEGMVIREVKQRKCQTRESNISYISCIGENGKFRVVEMTGIEGCGKQDNLEGGNSTRNSK